MIKLLLNTFALVQDSIQWDNRMQMKYYSRVGIFRSKISLSINLQA